MGYTPALSGLTGFLTGFVVTPPAMLLGAGAGAICALAAELPSEALPHVSSAGAITGATLLIGLLEALRFT